MRWCRTPFRVDAHNRRNYTDSDVALLSSRLLNHLNFQTPVHNVYPIFLPFPGNIRVMCLCVDNLPEKEKEETLEPSNPVYAPIEMTTSFTVEETQEDAELMRLLVMLGADPNRVVEPVDEYVVTFTDGSMDIERSFFPFAEGYAHNLSEYVLLLTLKDVDTELPLWYQIMLARFHHTEQPSTSFLSPRKGEKTVPSFIVSKDPLTPLDERLHFFVHVSLWNETLGSRLYEKFKYFYTLGAVVAPASWLEENHFTLLFVGKTLSVGAPAQRIDPEKILRDDLLL